MEVSTQIPMWGLYIIGLFCSILMLLMLVDRLSYYANKKGLSWSWLCQKLGWHTRGKYLEFDGCSSHVQCARCGKDVSVDSNGDLL
jgi:hypothetical protein